MTSNMNKIINNKNNLSKMKINDENQLNLIQKSPNHD